MTKHILLFFLFTALLPLGSAFAQQDPQYSEYMFNHLALNPAYAGSRNAINTSLFLRNQWMDMDGAPKTQSFSIHGPLKEKKIGLGFNALADQLGPKKITGLSASYAYTLPFVKGKLAMGLRYGFYSYVFNWNLIDYKDKNDPYIFYANQQNNLSNVDAGLYYYTSTFYTGASVAHIIKSKIVYNTDITLSPHLYVTMGKSFLLSEKLILNPGFVIKSTMHAPVNADININALLDERLWLGLSFRSGYGVVILSQLYVTQRIKLGYAYDRGINRIGRVGGGSHEIMLGYDFNIQKSKMLSPRYL